MHKVLEDIVAKKRADIAVLKCSAPLALQPKSNTNRFYTALAAKDTTNIIAEIKLASPTHPNLGHSSNVVQRARDYQAAGAAVISFITEQHYFKSNITHIAALTAAVNVPILQKDFVIDEYQIYQAAAIGSSALLLIARLVDTKTLQRFVKLTQAAGIEPVVEVDNAHDLQRALTTTTRCIAVNARDLGTFTVNVAAACELIAVIPNTYLRLGFSGVTTKTEVQQYAASGADAVLVGTGLMQAKNVKQKIQELQS